jgi:hypothetical protein
MEQSFSPQQFVDMLQFCSVATLEARRVFDGSGAGVRTAEQKTVRCRSSLSSFDDRLV